MKYAQITKKYYPDNKAVENLVWRLSSGTLPQSEWGHSARLTLILWAVRHYAHHDALHFVRETFKKYHRKTLGFVASKRKGYHETRTLFWVWAVRKYALVYDEGQDISEFANDLVNSDLSDETLINAYYNSVTLESEEARRHWVQPDLRALD
ncbi:hypothetical protein [Microscilla marina]|uniref:Uncharacterized protein n=1 Tax=Microscilla marina ATCC 23134 TaxID=313606 RepID=A1ZMP1_MICM2|nr:hypothetical protein [Microscilla marina]EAY28421.1 conserved hypothetical protein [Microscilla marina ATCC 23134]